MERDVRAALGYRRPMPVREAVCYRSGEIYPLCPRCQIPLDREYQGFCDRCGQRLEWRDYSRARVLVRF